MPSPLPFANGDVVENLPTFLTIKWQPLHLPLLPSHAAVLLHQEMSCNGKPLVPAENWRHYSRILEVEVGVTASAVTQHLLDFYFVSFRAEEAELAFKVRKPRLHSPMPFSLSIAQRPENK